jgi:CMP-N-acetylneuraminic acid synthetase
MTYIYRTGKGAKLTEKISYKSKKKLSFFALITARGGSVGIKNKNLKKIGNYSLLEMSIFATKKVKKINQILIPDVIFLIQPTSPFLEKKVITEIIKLYTKNPEANCINSYIKVPHKFNYINHASIDQTGKVNYLNYKKRAKNPLRQNKKVLFAHGNIFSFKTKALLKQKTLTPKPIYAHILDKKYKSIDIDDYEDLKIAQIIHKKKI